MSGAGEHETRGVIADHHCDRNRCRGHVDATAVDIMGPPLRESNIFQTS